MRATDLIRCCDGVELPAVGRWPIARGQPMIATRRRRLVAKTFEVVTRCGELQCAAEPSAVTLELEVGLPASCSPAGRVLAFEGALVKADRFGQWSFVGTARSDGLEPCSVELTAAYHGVFARGPVPVALLSITAAVPMTKCGGDPGWPPLRSLLTFRGDLNAEYCRTG